MTQPFHSKAFPEEGHRFKLCQLTCKDSASCTPGRGSSTASAEAQSLHSDQWSRKEHSPAFPTCRNPTKSGTAQESESRITPAFMRRETGSKHKGRGGIWMLPAISSNDPLINSAEICAGEHPERLCLVSISKGERRWHPINFPSQAPKSLPPVQRRLG